LEYLRSKAYLIKGSKIVVMDTNIPEESIEYVVDLCNKVKVPVLIEPVSMEKAKKLRKIVNGCEKWTVDYITPSKNELKSILGVEMSNNQDLDMDMDMGLDLNIVKAAEELKGKGIKNVIVTLGKRGVYVSGGGADKERKEDCNKFITPYRSEIVDVTGAGDALVAGLVYGIYKGYSMEVAVRFGLAAAALTVSTKETVRRDLREGLLKSRIKEEDNK